MDLPPDRGGRITFPPFVLDAANARLCRGAEVIRLRGKSLAVLEYLAQRPGQLVSKNELLEALWPATYVTETALAGCVRELRDALGDSRGKPQFIETVYGRGYRFVAQVSQPSTVERPEANRQSPVAAHHVVGRDGELAQLEAWLQLARDGHRQVVFIAGDVGIGKTTLVNAFIEDVRRRMAPAVLVARGQCIEQYGPGEPFLPVLEALARLCRADGAVAARVRRCVPPWLLSLSGENEHPQASSDATAERSVRILVEAIEAVTAAQPLLLLVEDLHWSDPSTLDVVSYLAQRPDPARLLVVGTYRPVDAIMRQHPLRVVEQELRTRRHSVQLPLRLLSRNAVAHWLEGLCPNPPPSFAEWMYRRTDGHPFFLSALLEDMKASGLVECAGRWSLSPRFAEMGVPQSLRLMIDQQVDRLDEDDRRLLQAASAVGVRFSAAAVAAGLGRDTVETEERCNALARRGHFLRAEGAIDWADGTVAGAYAFQHTLYQNVLYDRLPPARRQVLHAQIARRLEQGYGAHAGDFAVELAVHFERARDAVNAIRNLERAAHHCNQRGAHREAAASLRRALELVASLPDSRDRLQQALWLSLMLGAALIPITGYAEPELQETFQRCCQLAEQLGETPQLFAALTGLATCYLARGQLSAASPVSERLLQLAEAMPVPVFTVLAHTAAGWLRCCQGNFSNAVEHLLHAKAVHAAEVPRETINIDPGTLAVSALCLALLPLGRVDEARARMAQEVARSRQSERAIDRVTVLSSSSLLHGNLGAAEVAEQHAAEALTVAAANGLREPPIAAALHAWAIAMRDGSDAALASLGDRVAAYRAAGFGTYLSAILTLAAAAHARAGRVARGLQLLTQAGDHIESTGEHWCAAEVYRLRGELLMRQHRGRTTRSSADKSEATRDAKGWIDRALDTARRQGAKLWELRATMVLARFRHEQRRTAEARALLEPIAAAFPAGQELPELDAARTLLARLR